MIAQVFDYCESTLEKEHRTRKGIVEEYNIRKWMGKLRWDCHSFMRPAYCTATLSCRAFLDSGGNVRIADLRIAFIAGDVLGDRHVVDRGFNTACARAPEVCSGAPKPSFPLDAWALGVIALSSMIGSRLFHPNVDRE